MPEIAEVVFRKPARRNNSCANRVGRLLWQLHISINKFRCRARSS